MRMLHAMLFKLLVAVTLFTLAIGCRRTPTAILVRIESDFDPTTNDPNLHMEMIRVRVYPNNQVNSTPADDRTYDIGPGRYQLPFEFWVRPGDDDNLVMILVDGFHVRMSPAPDVGFVQARAITSFRQNRRIVLRLGLWRGCIGVRCDPMSTCGMSGQCVSAVVNPETLPEYNPDGGTMPDGSMTDASTDSQTTPDGSVTDASTDGSTASCLTTLPGSDCATFTQLSSTCGRFKEIAMASLPMEVMGVRHLVSWIDGNEVRAAYLNNTGGIMGDVQRLQGLPTGSPAFIGSLQVVPRGNAFVVSWLQVQTATGPTVVYLAYVEPGMSPAPTLLNLSSSFDANNPPRHRIAVDPSGMHNDLWVCHQSTTSNATGPIQCQQYSWNPPVPATAVVPRLSPTVPNGWLVAVQRRGSDFEALTADRTSLWVTNLTSSSSHQFSQSCVTDTSPPPIFPTSVHAFVDDASSSPRWHVSAVLQRRPSSPVIVGYLDASQFQCTSVGDISISIASSARTALSIDRNVNVNGYRVVWTEGSSLNTANIPLNNLMNPSRFVSLNTSALPNSALATPPVVDNRLLLGYIAAPAASDPMGGVPAVLSYSCSSP